MAVHGEPAVDRDAHRLALDPGRRPAHHLAIEADHRVVDVVDPAGEDLLAGIDVVAGDRLQRGRAGHEVVEDEAELVAASGGDAVPGGEDDVGSDEGAAAEAGRQLVDEALIGADAQLLESRTRQGDVIRIARVDAAQRDHHRREADRLLGPRLVGVGIDVPAVVVAVDHRLARVAGVLALRFGAARGQGRRKRDHCARRRGGSGPATKSTEQWHHLECRGPPAGDRNLATNDPSNTTGDEPRKRNGARRAAAQRRRPITTY